jgi:hypothetical protein
MQWNKFLNFKKTWRYSNVLFIQAAQGGVAFILIRDKTKKIPTVIQQGIS